MSSQGEADPPISPKWCRVSHPQTHILCCQPLAPWGLLYPLKTEGPGSREASELSLGAQCMCLGVQTRAGFTPHTSPLGHAPLSGSLSALSGPFLRWKVALVTTSFPASGPYPHPRSVKI